MRRSKQAEEIDTTPEDDDALDDACDEVGREILAKMGISPERIAEIQAMGKGKPRPAPPASMRRRPVK
jgi:hypothetical protein